MREYHVAGVRWCIFAAVAAACSVRGNPKSWGVGWSRQKRLQRIVVLEPNGSMSVMSFFIAAGVGVPKQWELAIKYGWISLVPVAVLSLHSKRSRMRVGTLFSRWLPSV